MIIKKYKDHQDVPIYDYINVEKDGFKNILRVYSMYFRVHLLFDSIRLFYVHTM
mgnify:FL=1